MSHSPSPRRRPRQAGGKLTPLPTDAQARWDAVLADQPTLPFEGEDAALVDGYTRVQKAKDELRERRALTSGCSCGHQRAEHVGTRLVCGARGCPCVHFKR